VTPGWTGIAPLALTYLERQSWYQKAIEDSPGAPVEVEAFDVLRQAHPGLGRLILTRGRRHFQLLVGWREPSQVAGVLQGRDSALFGATREETTDQDVLAYDALADDELLLALLGIVTEGAESATRARRVSTLVSHASIVFDERLFMKCYRVLEEGERPEAEVMYRLDEVGFNAMLAPVARWRAHGFDLALVREFLPSALEGQLLAFTSLRDLLAHVLESNEGVGEGEGPVHDADAETASAGGDLSSEMRRLGQMTASLHLALAKAFGDEPAEPSRLSALVRALAGPGATRREEELADAIGSIRSGEAGRATRIHGDYHLRRVLRAEPGWLVAGFSDDPLFATARNVASLPARFGSPVEDLADMCFSLHCVALEGVAQRPPGEAEWAGRLANAWERRNQLAFLTGYTSVEEVERLLPADPAAIETLLEAFLLERQRRYEATPSAE
jgi:maltokinase